MATSTYLSSAATMLAPVHLVSYSTLLGMQLWQSFAVTKITFHALPRSAFTTLNKRIFRVYFLGQAALVLITATTALALFAPTPSAIITFAVMAASSLFNLVLWEPRARQAMIDRIHQQTRDGKAATAPTAEMQVLNRQFSRSHAMCIHLNLVTIGATLWWGWKLAASIKP
ncbi:DUF4149 domain-containing protein [Microdochium nivale]|nr:DUF4149 domain-containing protein [Microdochium nivale]